MPEPLVYLQAMGAAAGVAAVVVLAIVCLRRPASPARVDRACVLAIASGLGLGYWVLQLRPNWPPASGLDRLLTLVVPVAIGLELVAAWERVPRWLAWLLRMSLAAASGRILLHGSVYLSGASGEWTAGQTAATLVVCGGLLAAVWALLARLSRRSAGVSIPLALALAIQCAGTSVMLAGYIQGGAAALPLVAALVGATVASSLTTRDAEPPGASGIGESRSGAIWIGAIGIGVVGLFGLLFIGRFFGRISTGAALVMLLAPLLCWATELPWLRRRSPWLVGALRIVLVAIPLAVVLVLAKWDFDRDLAPLLGQGHLSREQFKTVGSSLDKRPSAERETLARHTH